MRVLIIDDSSVMRKIIEAALRHSGIKLDEVLQAADGLEGLAALDKAAAQEEAVDLILCDVHMPRMDGLGFLLGKPKRKLAHEVPVVMITADAADPYLLRAIAAGAQGYISKPFTLQQIQASLSPVLEPAAVSSHSDRVLAASGAAQTRIGGQS
jgi:two-component system, chemotaxis family, chemotaxis protein CheY